MHRVTCKVLLGAGAFFVVTAPPSSAQKPRPLPAVPRHEYEVVDLGTLEGTISRAEAISENGTIAGYATTAPGHKHAVLWDPTGIVDLGVPPGWSTSEAVAVNDAGQVACNAEGNPQALRAYRWENGVWTPLGVLPGRNESAPSSGGRA